MRRQICSLRMILLGVTKVGGLFPLPVLASHTLSGSFGFGFRRHCFNSSSRLPAPLDNRCGDHQGQRLRGGRLLVRLDKSDSPLSQSRHCYEFPVQVSCADEHPNIHLRSMTLLVGTTTYPSANFSGDFIFHQCLAHSN
jgi:hypothetical protein